MLRKVPPLLWIAAIAASLWLIFPYGFPTYDTRYALVWGDETAHGIGPDYGAGQPPTPHPLADLWGAVVSPLGAFGAGVATTVVAYLAIAATGYLVYRLAARWFDRPIGLVAALLVLTRPPIHCQRDALLRRSALHGPGAGGARGRESPAAVRLAGAGAAHRGRPAAPPRPGSSPPPTSSISWSNATQSAVASESASAPLSNGGRVAPLVVLAASAPLLWGSFDVATTGEPLYSFTATRDRVQTLERSSGPGELVTGAPYRLGEVMGRSGLLAAVRGTLARILPASPTGGHRDRRDRPAGSASRFSPASASR